MDKETFREMCLAHVMGSLEGREAREFQEALAAADEEWLAIFAEAVSLAQNLSLAAPPAEPSPKVKEILMAKVREEAAPAARVESDLQRVETRHHRVEKRQHAQAGRNQPTGLSDFLSLFRTAGWFGPGFAFAMAALGIGVLAYSFALKGTVGRQEAVLEQSLQRITALEDTLVRKEALLEVLLSHNLQVAVLAGEGPSPSGYGKMIWCPKRRCGILHVANLPAVPDGKDYQLWLVRDGGPTDAGVFQVRKTTWDGDLFRIQGMAEVAKDKVKGFFITLEPKGGVSAPGGKVYLKGATLM